MNKTVVRKKYLLFVFVMIQVLLSSVPLWATYRESGKRNFNDAWSFKRLAENESEAGLQTTVYDDSSWDSVRLPHTANREPLLVNNQWQGICWYRKTFNVSTNDLGKKIFLELEAAMNESTLWLNGQQVAEHLGGYLPVVVDISDHVKPGENVLAVRLDNRDNPTTGPKPLKRLDFCMYGGLYRNAWLTVKDPIYITHPILAGRVAGGGVFITTPKVSPNSSVVHIKTHVKNETQTSQMVEVVQSIWYQGRLIQEQQAKAVRLKAGLDKEVDAELVLQKPHLWSPRNPNLYLLETTVKVEGKVVDEQSSRFGIREFTFKDNQLYINGEMTFLRGVNRHQEYPFIGYALSDNAQYRDAKKIKDAGFNYIRLSHYPHSPSFMDACDELGLVCIDAIMGWQYFGKTDAFTEYCFRSATDLLRRDRNHPCVLAWEVSLNETRMPIPFMQRLHDIVHEEYPGPNVYSCGWMDDVYDIYLQARQHRILHHQPENHVKPYVISEYGDWEYYSNNAGLNQHKYPPTVRLEMSSRQLRSHGEVRLLQQAMNLQESHNDNLADTPAFADSYWVMYDYNRGYHDEIEASGIMDIFRLPKFGYDFYQSQRTPEEGVVVKIASYWTKESPLDVRVFSNCEEVKLYLNDKLIGAQTPDQNKNTTKLSHPPFTFKLEAFEAGTLKAVGLIAGKVVGEHIVRTPQAAKRLVLSLDTSHRSPQAADNDVLFLYIMAVDEQGTLVPDFTGTIDLQIQGEVTLMNTEAVQAEAGIATALVRVGENPGSVRIRATAEGLNPGGHRFTVE